MTYLDQPGSADAVDKAINGTQRAPRSGPASGRHAQLETDFTGPLSDAGTRRQSARSPKANELGLVASHTVPRHGWRKVLHQITGGAVNLGESAAESNWRALIDLVNRPVRGSYSIAVLSLKGGVGKTATTFGLGATFASLRGDRVIAVDANPDFGTLGQRGPSETRSTVRHLLTDGEILRYPDMRRHTSQTPSRLEILVSERNPAVSEVFSEDDYHAVYQTLDRFYNIILADCGTGLTHSATRGVLNVADALVVVAAPAIDSARSALATLDWLQCHGYAHLVPDTTIVLSSVQPGAMPIQTEHLVHYFQSRVRSVFVVPYDPHLAAGGEIFLDLMSPKTRRQYVELAASVADGFGRKNQTPG